MSILDLRRWLKIENARTAFLFRSPKFYLTSAKFYLTSAKRLFTL